MLRFALALAVCLAPIGVPTAWAPQAWAAEPAVACTVNDDRVGELSGLVVTAGGFIAINDSNFDPRAIKVFYLTKACRLSRAVSYPSAARDPEDLARAPDGTLWIADIGDNYNAAVRRTTIALWKLAPGSAKPVIHRLTYPDGPHDAEALLLDGDGTPIIVTKELSGRASVYVPSARLVPNSAAGVALSKVGEVRLPDSQTPNFLDSIGRRLVTGGAVSPDGRYAVLRTYADAWEYDVPGGDVIKALTEGTPRQTPLPSEPQGEAIAYTPDGSAFVTASDQPFGPTSLLRYTPAARRPASSSPVPDRPSRVEVSAQDTSEAPAPMPNRALFALGLAGLILIAVGVAASLMRRALR